MIFINVFMGCAGFMLSGHAFTRHKDTGDARWLATGIFEVLTATYFIVSSVGLGS